MTPVLKCRQCPRRCQAKRTADENIGGFCGMPALPKVARCALHHWEEPCISGTNGSGTIFFSGCSLKCVFCQNDAISHGNAGTVVSYHDLAAMMRSLEERGAHNINFVNPTHYVGAIKEALAIYRPGIPLVCNSGGYDLMHLAEEDVFDVYLMDLKWMDPAKSARYAHAADYFEHASRLLIALDEICGEAVLDENGLMQRGLIVRHLLMPRATNEAIRIMDWVKAHLPHAYFSLMAQYLPCGQASQFPEIDRRITKREYEKVVDHLLQTGMEHVYVQERESADASFIPSFDGTGVIQNNGKV